jgi:hypothetical protein
VCLVVVVSRVYGNKCGYRLLRVVSMSSVLSLLLLVCLPVESFGLRLGSLFVAAAAAAAVVERVLDFACAIHIFATCLAEYMSSVGVLCRKTKSHTTFDYCRDRLWQDVAVNTRVNTAGDVEVSTYRPVPSNSLTLTTSISFFDPHVCRLLLLSLYEIEM